MKRLGGLPTLIGAIGALLIGGLARPASDGADPETMDSWAPTASEVRAAVGFGPPGSDTGRRERFEAMLTGRYRSRQLAVRVMVHPPDRIELRCGANMSRPLMARIAVQTEREASSVFGRRFALDVYETFVVAPRRKVAELRYDPSSTRTTITFGAYGLAGNRR
ncbi:MAG: hypothetical protein FJX72_13980 [Armatimonadetes bacterium]|nr:hypothetical protein [Armatimonadota bacterium]